MNEQDALETRQSFFGIVEEYGGVPEKGKVKFWKRLSKQLSKAVGNDDIWNWRYPKQVYDGSIIPSQIFRDAVMALGASIDGTPGSLLNTRPVVVYAGKDIEDGSIVLGKSKMCERPGCKVLFVPNVPWRKYCCEDCGILARK